MKNIIKKILREEIENDYSWIDGYLNQEDPLEQVKEFIFNKLKDCELIPSEKEPGWTIYLDKEGDLLFLDNIGSDDGGPCLIVDRDEMWLKCKKEIGECSWINFKEICKYMLYETYGRKVDFVYLSELKYEVYI